MDLGLKGKVVLISGSYRGTGAGTAKVLATEGAIVAIHGHQEGQASAVADEIRLGGGEAIEVHGSLLTTDGVENIVSDVEHRCGPVDVLVNNYGAPAKTNWSDPAELWHEAWETNVVSGVRLTQRVLPSMKERGWGRIIFLGTVGTEKPGKENPDYYASKAALPVAVRSLAKDLNGTGITANLISPGIIATHEVRQMLEKRASRHNVEGWEQVQRWAIENVTPNLTGRIPEPHDIGRYVAFLASEAAWHITGADFKADGGTIDT